MAANPNPTPSHASTNSDFSVGSGSAANANAALLRAFNPAATQIPEQSALAGLTRPDAHSLAIMPQHGLPHGNNNNLGQQQPMSAGLAVQMRKLVEQRGFSQNTQMLIPTGDSAGTNGGTGVPVAPEIASGFSETRDVQWIGTFVWHGTDPARNEKKEVQAQIVATASSGNPKASTWPKVLTLAPAGPAVPMNEFQEWMRRTQPVLMQISAAPGADEHGYGQLVKLLREKGFYAVTGWEIPGTGRTTMNLLIALFSQGLLGAAFPVSGIPEMPKLPQLDPATMVHLDPAVRQAILNTLPPHARNIPEPQLSYLILQIFLRQHRSQDAAALSQQQQQQQQMQQTQQTQQQPDRFPQNPGVDVACNGPMFGNLYPFVHGSQANAIASGLMVPPTTSLLHQLAQAQQQQQQAQQNQRRTILDMQPALSGGGLVNTGPGSGGLGMPGSLGSQDGAGFGNGGNGMAGAGIGLDSIRSAASSGPVIIINHSRWRSDILIIQNNMPPSLVSTPDDFYSRTSTLKDKLLDSQRKFGVDSSHYEETLATVLCQLYELIGKFVIDRLRQLQVPEQSRIWWCPTSVLCCLPLHAMGPIPSDDGEPRYFSDLYICSYTPTLSALIQSRHRSSSLRSSDRPPILLVAQSDSLPNVRDEIQVVQSLDTKVTSLISEAATPATVIDGLHHHRFVHFACHGTLEVGKPFEAGFELHGDARLTLLEIVRAHLPTAEFAFLAACHTAEVTEGSVIDEGLHLAAAIQSCGFRSVVGTMWAMADTDGRDLAKYFYKALFSGSRGIPYHEGSAEALQSAVNTLRRKRGITLERWVNFVHYGA